MFALHLCTFKMLNSVIESFLTIASIFAFSTLTAYAICKVTRTNFINPDYSKSLIETRLKEMGQSVLGVLIPSSCIMYMLKDGLLRSSSHSNFQTFSNISMMVLITEGTFYIYHYSVHKFVSYISIHRYHHSVTNIYPFDTFHVTNLDEISLMLSLVAPRLFLTLTFFEVYATLWLYITGAYLVHSKELVKTHYYHHLYYNCNYCILFPIYDVIFGTFRWSNEVTQKTK